MKRAATALLAVAVGASVGLAPAALAAAAPRRPWMNQALTPEERAGLLVAQMTLDEKVSQIHMLDVSAHPREVPGIPRLGVPAFKVTNGPAGAGPGDSPNAQPATALPAALALSATWDPAQARAFGRIVGIEVSSRGEHLLEAPGVNIARVPRNGRNFEYFGEDPYLAGQIAVPEIQAVQAEGILTEVKHFAANNQENQRKTIDVRVDERTLREIYLPAFEASVRQGGAAAVMCAYPKVNGDFGCENSHLLADILRRDWGFSGFVQSDYTATHSTVKAALAGLDLSMKHDFYGEATKTAVLNGQLPESTVDTMVARRLAQMFRFGIFDNPPAPRQIPAREHGAVARSIARQGAVLLKNSGGQLPLDAGALRSIAVIGPYAGAAHTGGTGSSAVTPLYTVSPVSGIRGHVPSNVRVRFNDGSDPNSAANLARSSDVAIVMVGNKDREGTDRADLSLPGNQNTLVSAVAAASPHTVVVLKTGGPVLMPWLNSVEAVLEAWYPGEEDGNVVADLLFGNANPSGRLSMTFPRTETDTAAHTAAQYPGINGTVTYSEGLQVGYRWNDAQNVTPLFPFGFGLSYTTFALRNLAVPATPPASGPVTVAVDVTNTGSRAGAEVVQVYVSSPAAAGAPPKQLRGFAKVALQPGETRRVTIALDPRAFSIWDTGAWRTVRGGYGVLVGDSSANLPLRATITA
jgi:beta-glucosidase